MKKVIIAILLIVTICSAVLAEENVKENQLIIRYIDVGQGDCSIIQYNDKVVMIDGGSREYNQKVYTILKKELNINSIDYMISTHPHDDHISGLMTAISVCDIGEIYTPVNDNSIEVIGELTEKIKEKNTKVIVPEYGQKIYIGELVITFISSPQPEWNINDNSLIVRMDYRDTSFLFTADAGWNAEQQLLANNTNIKADVIKIGHHGSYDSTSRGFLEEVNPKYAVISVGKDNGYGHPSDEVIQKLSEQKVTVYRTDKRGTITCISDGVNIKMETEKTNRKW